jgi:hypothetical protein
LYLHDWQTQPTICTLPYDILTEIFKDLWAESYLDVEEPFLPTRLGAVCAFWRQVAWSTPRLWTELRLSNRFWWSKDRAYILDLYFKNIGNLTLELSICDYPTDIQLGQPGKRRRGKRSREVHALPDLDGNFDPFAPAPFPAHDIFRTVFIRHPDKLKSVVMDQYVYSWLVGLENQAQSAAFPNLRHFAILSDEGEDPDLTFSFDDIFSHPPITILNVPALRDVVLIGTRNRFYFPWAQILSLDLSVVSANYAMRVVLECINLQHLCLLQLEETFDVDVEFPQEPLSLKSLKSFEYSSDIGMPLSWDTGLAEHLMFTSLTTLCLNIDPRTFHQLANFLHNLPPTIQVLSYFCDDARAFIDSVFELFSRLDILHTLSLTFLDPVPIEIFRKLTPKPQSPNILPALASFELDLTPPANPLSKKKIQALLGLLRSRSGTRSPEGVESLRHFHLRLYVSVQEYLSTWSHYFRSGVADLARDGMEICVTTAEGTLS